jgi:hypothetical protein
MPDKDIAVPSADLLKHFVSVMDNAIQKNDATIQTIQESKVRAHLLHIIVVLGRLDLVGLFFCLCAANAQAIAG